MQIIVLCSKEYAVMYRYILVVKKSQVVGWFNFEHIFEANDSFWKI